MIIVMIIVMSSIAGCFWCLGFSDGYNARNKELANDGKALQGQAKLEMTRGHVYKCQDCGITDYTIGEVRGWVIQGCAHKNVVAIGSPIAKGAS
jgi:hypothetical protein